MGRGRGRGRRCKKEALERPLEDLFCLVMCGLDSLKLSSTMSMNVNHSDTSVDKSSKQDIKNSAI